MTMTLMNWMNWIENMFNVVMSMTKTMLYIEKFLKLRPQSQLYGGEGQSPTSLDDSHKNIYFEILRLSQL